jgi:hypothetical protein
MREGRREGIIYHTLATNKPKPTPLHSTPLHSAPNLSCIPLCTQPTRTIRAL